MENKKDIVKIYSLLEYIKTYPYSNDELIKDIKSLFNINITNDDLYELLEKKNEHHIFKILNNKQISFEY